MSDFLKDKTFLRQVDKMRIKEQYVKIIILDFFTEKPVQEIQGDVISGTINISGTSSIRRTCNLNMITRSKENNLTSIKNLISINKKVKIEIGLKNMTNQYNDLDILWFPQGVFVIVSANISASSSGVSMSLQLKDKMCLLNGECGGVFPASVTFSEYETLNEDGDYVLEHPTIAQIIKEIVNHYGGESLGRIYIRDIDDRIKQVIKWVNNSTPLYVIEEEVIEENKTYKAYFATTDQDLAASKSNVKMDDNGNVISNNISTYTYGYDIGYQYTDFTYPGDLVGDAGGNVCQVLDKIKNTLGNYEYFYDIDGNFVFQEIRNYLNTSYSTTLLNEMSGNANNYIVDISQKESVYTFDDDTLITSYSNSPQYNNIKNDFIVWGVRQSKEGLTLPIRYRLTIDEKPKDDNTYRCIIVRDEDIGNYQAKAALNFPNKSSLPKPGQAEVFYYVKDENTIYIWDTEKKDYTLSTGKFEDITTNDWRTELYLQGTIAEPLGTEFNEYFVDLKTEWPKLYDFTGKINKSGKKDFLDKVEKYPSDIDYFLDFIDSEQAISEFGVKSIGRRPLVINDNSINCIFEPNIQDIVIIQEECKDTQSLREECIQKKQEFMQVNAEIASNLAIGGHYNSAFVKIQELLYQYTNYNEQVNLSTVPIYYLEPNTRISIKNSITGLDGDFMINSISIPLNVSGTMNISCTKVTEKM